MSGKIKMSRIDLQKNYIPHVEIEEVEESEEVDERIQIE